MGYYGQALTLFSPPKRFYVAGPFSSKKKADEAFARFMREKADRFPIQRIGLAYTFGVDSRNPGTTDPPFFSFDYRSKAARARTSAEDRAFLRRE